MAAPVFTKPLERNVFGLLRVVHSTAFTARLEFHDFAPCSLSMVSF